MKKGFFNILLPESSSDAVGILLYGYIGNEEKIDSATIVSKIKELSLRYRNIDVRINSLGGEVYAGLAIFNAIRESEANINIYVDGVAASMAAVIALCGRPLHMSRYSRLMLHSVSGGVSGTAKYIRTYADQIDSLTDTLIEIVAERTNLSVEEVRGRWFDGNDHWITSTDALSLGLIDSIYDMKATPMPADSEELTAESIYEFTNRLSIEPQNNNQNMNLMEELRKYSSFNNANSEADVLEQIQKLENAAAKAEALEARVNELLAEKEEAINSARESFLNQAVQEGKIKESQ
jgi:ATP-dependent Clp endopeptidase proteolytic subunit ClpP